jgi:hypothetical protein
MLGDFMRDIMLMGLPGLQSAKYALEFAVEVKFSMLCDVGVSFRMRPELVAALYRIYVCRYVGESC